MLTNYDVTTESKRSTRRLLPICGYTRYEYRNEFRIVNKHEKICGCCCWCGVSVCLDISSRVHVQVLSAWCVVFIVRCLPMFCSLIYDFTKSVLVEIVSGIVLDGCWCFKMVLLFLSVDLYLYCTHVVRVPVPVVPCIICCCRLSFVEPT